MFYPTRQVEDHDNNNNPFPSYTPIQEYPGGVHPEDLKPFGLREDSTWRDRMQVLAGTDGYAGNEVFSDQCDGFDEDKQCLIDYENPYGFPLQQEVVPVDQQEGALYSTCFRVNQKHQTQIGKEKFQVLLQGTIGNPAEIGKSVNLGCIDFYPVTLGKRNCCQYIAQLLGTDMSLESVCICDDNNDIEMALATAHAYIPALTSASMEETIQNNPTHFTQTFENDKVTLTLATDAALRWIQDRVQQQTQ